MIKNSKKPNLYLESLHMGRKIIINEGIEELAMRKIARETKHSVGALYNHFKNFDEFTILQNGITIDNLILTLEEYKKDTRTTPYILLSELNNIYVNYIKDNKNLWQLLYSTHSKKSKIEFPVWYKKKLFQLYNIIEETFLETIPNINKKEARTACKTLWTSLFATSSLLITGNFDFFNNTRAEDVCQLLTNTYIAGIMATNK